MTTWYAISEIMNKRFSSISIIYNPHSTGDSKSMAKKLSTNLQKELDGVTIKLVATKYAGHARELAKQIAAREKTPLIISSSGDGGYNEVVNGVMEANNVEAVCAVLPAGNANDHSRTVQENRPLLKGILKGKVTKLDLLKVILTFPEGNKKTMYAHSYAGLGLTPVIAVELNKNDLNALNEILITLKTFFKYRPFKIHHDDKVIEIDSLLFANINQMAKILTLASPTRLDDGKFEVIVLPAGRKLMLVRTLVKALTSSLDTAKRYKTYEFTTIKKMPMQLDGEVHKLPAGSKVKVISAHAALKTVV